MRPHTDPITASIRYAFQLSLAAMLLAVAMVMAGEPEHALTIMKWSFISFGTVALVAYGIVNFAASAIAQVLRKAAEFFGSRMGDQGHDKVNSKVATASAPRTSVPAQATEG